MVDDSCWYGGGISENEKMVGVEIQTLIHGAWRAGARRSLESMDGLIKHLMGQMLKKNLANVGSATDSLLHRLGQN